MGVETTADDTSNPTPDVRGVLALLRDRLQARGVDVIGPFPGSPTPESDHLELADGKRVYVRRDSNGFWQAHTYDGQHVVRMADVSAADWPGDCV